MKTTWLLALLLAGFTVASAKTYSVTIYDRCMAGKVQLQPGDYKLKVEGSTAMLTNQDTGKNIQASVKVLDAKNKFDQTELDMRKVAGVQRIEEIHLGGTRMKVKFN